MPAKKAIKRGRPELPKSEVFGKVKPIRFQEAELKSFEKAAKADGMTFSEWVRKTLNEAVKQ